MTRRNPVVGALSGLWHALEWTRRLVLNLLFLAAVMVVVVLLLPGGGIRVPRPTALALDPTGELVEQLYGDPGERLMLELLGQTVPIETRVWDLVDAIERAKDDDRVELLVLELDGLTGAGLSSLEAVRQSIEEFKTAGKRVAAVSDYYLQPHYYLAAAADEVALNPMGAVLLTGFGSSRRYYRELLDRLEVEWNVFRVGEYKSAPEPFLRDGMSPEAREATGELLADLWGDYRRQVATARGLAEEDLQAYVDGFHRLLAQHGGDSAQLALAYGLVDRLATRDELRQWLIDEVGEEEDGTYRRIGFRSYLAAAGRPEQKGEKAVAVVVASGTILDGNQPPGMIGGESTSRLIREARENEEVAAVVLRVDSPGGSAFASEIVRREVELTRLSDKPIVASMGSIAASGGYWISMSADEIWAQSTTLTGSIGIYAMVPTFERTLGRVGIHADAVGTGPWAGRLRPEMALPDEVREALGLMIEDGYRDFIRKAAEGRGMTEEEVDRVARGRVWSGADAVGLGLVDRLGDLGDAIRAAADRAELGDDFRVVFYEKRPSARARWIQWLFSRAGAPGPRRAATPAGWLLRFAGLGQAAAIAERPEGPFALWAHCLCEPVGGGARDDAWVGLLSEVARR